MIKLGIIGLGQIGSSILKSLYKNKDYEIYCYSNSSFKKAKKYTKNASNDIKIVQNCDIIFVCCAINETLNVLNLLNEFLSKKTIVADVSSIKANLLDKTYNFNFILTHPMAGVEKSGFDSGFDGLFENCKWLVEKRSKLLVKIIQDMNAKPVKINMKNHDSLCAQISHLPTILSFLLFDSTTKEAKKIASSGFRDTTRLAVTDHRLALAMFNNNKENIIKSFDKIIDKLNYLKNLSDDEKINLFKAISTDRVKMYDKSGKNIL